MIRALIEESDRKRTLKKTTVQDKDGTVIAVIESRIVNVLPLFDGRYRLLLSDSSRQGEFAKVECDEYQDFS
jgi:hypothetical protein